MEAVVGVKYMPRLFLNGAGAGAAGKKMRPAAAAAVWGAGEAGVYRECLKNHAASLGGHALDGCGEFMPAPGADPADPGSLRCAACGCHRNFHRRVPEAPPSPPLLALPPPPPPQQPAPAPHVVRDGRAPRGEEAPEDRLPTAFDEETESSDEGSDFDEDRQLSPLPAPAVGPPGYLQPPPHMHLALGTGAPGASTPAAAPRPPAPRARCRRPAPRQRRGSGSAPSSARSRSSGCRRCRSGWGGGCRSATRRWSTRAAARSASPRASSRSGCTTTSTTSSPATARAAAPPPPLPAPRRPTPLLPTLPPPTPHHPSPRRLLRRRPRLSTPTSTSTAPPPPPTTSASSSRGHRRRAAPTPRCPLSHQDFVALFVALCPINQPTLMVEWNAWR